MELDTEKGDDLETIRERLSEARRWFDLHQPGFPRTPRIAPRHLPENRKDAVRGVAFERSGELLRSGNRSNGVASHLNEVAGRLLRYAPDDSLSDGGSEVYTGGFFDVHDEPPWDLWLGWVVEANGDAYLLSWIPQQLVETAEKGIWAASTDCIRWVPELEEVLGLKAS